MTKISLILRTKDAPFTPMNKKTPRYYIQKYG